MQMIWKENRVTKESKGTRTDRAWDKIANYFGYVPKEKCDVLLSHLTETVTLLAEGQAIIDQQKDANQLVMQFFTQMGIASFSVDPETRVVNHVDFDENIVVNQSLVKALLDFGIEVSIPMQEDKDPLVSSEFSGPASEETQKARAEAINEYLGKPEDAPEIPTVTPDVTVPPEGYDGQVMSKTDFDAKYGHIPPSSSEL